MLMNDAHTDWDAKDNDTRPAIVTLQTNGVGYWSRIVRDVMITELQAHVYGPLDDEDDDYEDDIR